MVIIAPMDASVTLSETEYRKKIQEAFDRIDRALADVDPDLAECEQSLGAMTIALADRSRCILSAQPSVRQLWLAVAALGIAHHFNFDPKLGRWLDDKGKGIELMSFMKSFLKERAGVSVDL